MGKNNHIINWTNDQLAELADKDEKLSIELLKNNGRKCCKESSLYKNALSIRAQFPNSNDIDLLFNTFKEQFYNYNNLRKTGNEITLIFEECTCDMVKKGVSNSFLCNCTIGYTNEIFETLFNKKVEVILEKSILGGDDFCEQKIKILS